MHGLLRILAILINPAAEAAWVEKDDDDPVFLMLRYVAPLAAIPPVFRFVGACIIGVVVPGVGSVRAPLLVGILSAVVGYLESFVLVLVLALITSLAAPLFGARRNFVSALKLAVFSYTPVWLAGIFLILPGLRFLALTGFYGACVLVAGLPHTMRPAREKAPGFAALIAVFACALTFAAAAAQRVLFGAPGL
jgi:Yip1 domain